MIYDTSILKTAAECDKLIEKTLKINRALESKKTILQLKLDISSADNSEVIEEIGEIQSKFNVLTNELASMEEGEKKRDMKILQTRLLLRLQLLEKQIARNGPVARIKKVSKLRILAGTIELNKQFIEQLIQRKNELASIQP